ncbi:hypothetical protein [Anaeromicropila populeti]|uniref:Uncharacterized protein n=1 Tax=Anaeromicropila populeti TaxID=37658 RepID=A0A1I6IQU8_9FIRM|nr:hypothetical protein [Anaeromicropila populeti]SFR69009.1 hypothetical protein SAMN05661086_01042 [Anaeromicropila populeti]
MTEEAKVFNLLFISGLVAAGVFLMISIILFFRLHIVKVIGVLTGSSAKKGTQQIREKSQSVENVRRLEKQHGKSKELKGKTAGLKKATKQLKKESENQVSETTVLEANETAVLGQNETAVLDTNETIVLGEGQTTVLGGNETSVLDQLPRTEKLSANRDTSEKQSDEIFISEQFVIINEISFIHSDLNIE